MQVTGAGQNSASPIDGGEQLLFSLCHAYGTGAEDIFNGGFELVAWRDFVEDVEKAYPDKDDY